VTERISVNTELVREFVLERIAAVVEERFPGTPGDAARAALDRVATEVLGLESPSAAGVALARRGYLARIAETELFEPARTPTPGLADRLRARVESPTETMLAAFAGELARAEPAERPDPDDERSFAWRVPGPGGHVRHYLAIGAIRTSAELAADDTNGDLKRCWLYGFYVRCCEEALGA
jgi:hypothetical protein